MTSDLDKLLRFLEVEKIDQYLFSGNSPKRPSRIFGGQVLAQALNAAIRTVDATRLAHSMHAYFLRPGNPSKQIIYDVDPIRDGKSFTTRSVVARQDGVAIFNASISFHIEEPGLSHQCDAPQVPAPEELESDYDRWSRLAQENPDKIDAPVLHPIERRPVRQRDFLNPQPEEPQQQVWVRALGNLGDDLCRHQTVSGIHVRLCLAGHGTDATSIHRYEQGSAVGQSGSRPVVSPSIQSRRVSVVLYGQSHRKRRTWI